MTWGRYETDIWQVGIVHAPIARLLEAGSERAAQITWLPAQRDFCFLADPFGLWRGEHLHVFVEAYDYRDKHGVIRRYTYDRNLALRDEGLALRARHHLSYPQIIEDNGEVFMLPEAHHSGKLTLYRARAFPGEWEKVCDLLDVPAVDASVIKHADKWWMFYALPGPAHRAVRELHVAFADQLTGPWTPHPRNPVRTALDSSRPGGTPFMADGKIHLPTQDCGQTYGGAVTVLRIEDLSPQSWTAAPARHLAPAAFNTPFTDGLHTLSSCGEVTLIDVKRIERSKQRGLINLQRRWRRLARALTPGG
jgi:hypothetical protein